MAKISARGATEFARINYSNGIGHTGILVLRSDGKVLRRLTGSTPTGYTIIGSLPKKGLSVVHLHQIARRLGLRVDRVVCK